MLQIVNFDDNLHYASLKFLGSHEVASLNVTLLTSSSRTDINTLDNVNQVLRCCYGLAAIHGYLCHIILCVVAAKLDNVLSPHSLESKCVCRFILSLQ